MSSARFTQTLKDFENSPEAQAPLAPNPYHDEVRPAASTTREIAERRERIAREETYESAGRSGMIPEGGSIAFERTRSKQESVAPVLDAKAQQIAIIAAMTAEKASKTELAQIGDTLKTSPRLREVDEWLKTLKKIRQFHSRRI